MAEGKSLGFVFIHGAGLGPWVWDGVTAQVQVPFLCVEFPPKETRKDCSLDDYVAHVVSQVAGWNMDRVVVVAHSFGGLVALKAASQLGDRLAGFVGVSAAIPQSGHSFLSVHPLPKQLFMSFMLRVAGTKPPDAAIKKSLCNDLNAEQTAMVVSRFTPESVHIYTDPITYALDADLPSLYIALTEDNEFGLSLQTKMANNLPSPQITELPTGHMPMLKDPEALAAKLNDFIGHINLVSRQ